MNKRFPPNAVLLAAGLGTRLRPLTLKTPKPLIEVAGKPLIERVIAPLIAEGVTRFAINTHYLADQMETAVAALPARFAKTRFFLSREDGQLRDTGGGARAALTLVASDPVLIVNTDAFWRQKDDAPLERMAARQDQDLSSIVLLCAHPARALGFRRSHDFCLDPTGTVTGDSGLPVIYAGVALVPRARFADTPDGPFPMTVIFERAFAEGALRGVLLDAAWFHIGDQKAYDEAERALAGN